MFCRRRIASADVSGATTSEPSGRSSTTTYSPERSPLSVTCSVPSVAMPQVWHGYRNELSGWKPGGSLWRRQTVLDRRPTIKKEPENKASTAIGPASTLPCPDLSRRRSPVRIRLGVLRKCLHRRPVSERYGRPQCLTALPGNGYEQRSSVVHDRSVETRESLVAVRNAWNHESRPGDGATVRAAVRTYAEAGHRRVAERSSCSGHEILSLEALSDPERTVG